MTIRELERQLLESRQCLAAILQTATDAILVTDDRGIIQSFNAAAERMFAFRRCTLEHHLVYVSGPCAAADRARLPANNYSPTSTSVRIEQLLTQLETLSV